MSAARFTAEAFVNALDALGGTPEEARAAAGGYRSTGTWIASQTSQAAGAGALAVAIPVMHLATIPAELAFLLHKLARCAWGVGSIVERGTPHLLPDGKPDLIPILGLWSGEFKEKDLVGIGVAAGGAGFVAAGVVYPTFAAAVIAKSLGKAAGMAVTTAFGGKAAGKMAGAMAAATAKKSAHAVLLPLLQKVSLWVAGKVGAKGASAFIPAVGPVVAASLNTYFVVRFGKCAEKYYRAKLQALES
nr:hypothetical protein [Micromonospora sp. DSM 115978]